MEELPRPRTVGLTQRENEEIACATPQAVIHRSLVPVNEDLNLPKGRYSDPWDAVEALGCPGTHLDQHSRGSVLPQRRPQATHYRRSRMLGQYSGIRYRGPRFQQRSLSSDILEGSRL